MSTYIISDIHGDKKSFEKILTKANFNIENDILYILGDIVDRGKDSIELLFYIMDMQKRSDRVYVIKGNHEKFLYDYLCDRMSENMYSACGGTGTIKELKKCDEKEKEKIKEYILSLPLLLEVEFDEFGTTVLTHSGLWSETLVKNAEGNIDVVESLKKGFEIDERDALCTKDQFFLPAYDLKNMDKFMIIGHTPCIRVNEFGTYKIYRRDRFMDVDSGAGHRLANGKLSLYRVEDGLEIYV